MQTFLAIILTFAGLVSIVIVVIFELTKTLKREADMREDEAMSEVPDDPRDWQDGCHDAVSSLSSH